LSINKLSDQHPRLEAEWDKAKNGESRLDDFTHGSDHNAWWLCESNHSWLAQVKNRVRNTNCPYCANKKVLPGFNDLQTHFPDVAEQWCYEKNDGVPPSMVISKSNDAYWWKCKYDHTWKARVAGRTTKKTDCPYCTGVKALAGFNDLQTVNPMLAAQWDKTKNGQALPEHYTAGSTAKVWWTCEHDHSWQAPIYSRSGKKQHGCPYCKHHYHLTGETDLLTVNPALASEWDTEANLPLTTGTIAPNDHRKVWWRCKLGHKWSAKVSNRNHGSGCPYCDNKRVLVGFNDLKTINPVLAEQWNSVKNGTLTAEMVVASSGKSVWWECNKHHSWKAVIAARNDGHDCPICNNRALAVGENDLKTLRPDLANEWDHEKNSPLLPENVFSQSTQRVWWTCKEGHSYEAIVYNRFYGTDCPYCNSNRLIVGENDLLTTHPHLFDEWDGEKNVGKAFNSFTAGSNIKIWWKCSHGHRWKASISARTGGVSNIRGTERPRCIGKSLGKPRLVM